MADSALNQILEQLASISKRLDNLESMRTIPTMSTTTMGPSNSILSTDITPSRASEDITVQHGIRALGLWRDKEFNLNREPVKYAFKLEGSKDYNVWSFSVLKLLETEGLSPFVLGSVPFPKKDDSNEANYFWLVSRWLEFDSAAMSAILNSVSKSQLPLLTQCSSACEMWSRLKDSYLLNSDVTVARLETELMTLTWKRNTPLEDFIAQIDYCAELLRGCGQTVPDSRLKMCLLRGLPDRLSSIQHVLLEQNNLSYHATCDRLRAHVSLALTQETIKENKAFTVSSNLKNAPNSNKPVISDKAESTETNSKHAELQDYTS